MIRIQVIKRRPKPGPKGDPDPRTPSGRPMAN